MAAQDAQARAIRSVVVIGAYRSRDYCTGFVARVDCTGTYLVTQSNFVGGREDRLKVCFFDQFQQPASVVRNVWPLCILRTDYYPRCREIQWTLFDSTLSRVLIFPPYSATESYCSSAFVTLENTKSYGSRSTDLLEHSDKFFLVSCPYTQKTFDNFSRLTCAPVFTTHGRGLGIVIQDCRPGCGAEMKLVQSAMYVVDLITRLIPPPTLKRGRAEWEEGSSSARPSKLRQIK